jgi:hypothetical protein
MKKLDYVMLFAVLTMALSLFVTGCSSSSSDSTPASSTNLVYSSNSTTVTVQPASAASTTLSTGNTNVHAVGFHFPANSVSTATQVSISEVDLTKSTLAPALALSATNSGNINIAAFTIATNPASVTVFNVPVGMGADVVTTATITFGTTLNLAMLSNGAWVDISTLTVSSSGVLTQNIASTSLPGILAPGTYLLYKPAAGTSTAVSNLGIALIADDGYGSSGMLQVVHLYDAAGSPLAVPTLTKLDYPGAYDIDGQALTPDGSQGILVDGGNTVRFFSNVQTGVPIASTATLDISSYGGDGDSVAIMPNGDTAVVSGDSASQLLVVSGITSGVPIAASTITIPGYRDGVVISDDGKVLLARGSGGLTVFSIGGTGPFTFTQTADMTTLGSSGMEDGRNGIALSPKDSSRAVIIGANYTATATLVTGLPGSPTAGTAVTLTGVTSVYSVSITPDGKTAIVGTNAGIVMLSGVDTGTLAQVGTNYAPTYAGASGSVTMGAIATLGITLEGKYAVVCDSGSYPGSSSGSLLVIPITATGFSAPVGILNGIAVPSNDQMVIH